MDFRSWLRRLDHQTDDEIAAEFADLRAHAAEVLRSPTGRAVRFLIASAAGLVGLVPGLAVGGADAFLIDKIVGRPGPAAFVSRWYPSIFREVASR